MREVVIVEGVRSAFGKRGGGLKDLAGTEIAGQVIRGLVDRTNILERGHVDDVFMGNVIEDEKSLFSPRYAAQLGGLPFDVSATYVEMQCGSAITAINHAAWKILMGMSDIAIVGGCDCHSKWLAGGRYTMSNTPYRDISYAPTAARLSPIDEQDTNMIQNSDLMGKKWEISREACDEYAYNSQQRLANAFANGWLGDEIVPVYNPVTGKYITKDEHPRPDVTLEKLKAMKPVYEGGVTTAGNASGRNDGAAFVLMMTKEKALELGFTPRLKWVTGADEGYYPNLMGVAAAYSNMKALRQAGLKMADVDVYECNEAFAAQNLAVIKEMETVMGEKMNMDTWNPWGGAIAIGHPNAASGARITTFAMKQLALSGGKYACVSSCCGGGMGTTTIFENLER
ncbi:MAG: thiolase family protein [Oscillibacter sp.]|nr:thiolase family protein [Oscillibacter sp.]